MGIGILGLQFAGIIFGLFMLYYTFLHKKRGEFSTNEAIVWSLAWLSFITLSLFPKITDPILQNLAFARRLDFFIVLGFIFLIGITYHNYVMAKITRKRVEYVVREVAMKKKK